MAASIIIISGACGTGKTSIAHLLAERSCSPCAVHIHTDDFYQYICKGYVEPWLEASNAQNATVMEAIASATESFSNNGYEVYIDGVVGPWFLAPWAKLAKLGLDIRYVILRPDEQTTISRALKREKNKDIPLTPETIKKMWSSFSDLGKYEANVVDTTMQTIEESVAMLQKMLQHNEFRL